MHIQRRDFLKTGVTLLGAGAVLPVVFQRALGVMGAETVHASPVDDGRVLVVVQMNGGNDGLNTVVPVSDSRYYSARPTINIAPQTALPVNATTGLHPSLAGLKETWDQGTLAIVEGVGYPTPNFSHFVSKDIWQNADPSGKVRTGWLGRYVEQRAQVQEAPFLALAVGGRLPTALATPNVVVPSLKNIQNYQFQGPAHPAMYATRLNALKALYAEGGLTSSYGPLLDMTMKAADTSIGVMQAAHDTYTTTVQYPTDVLGPALKLVAQVIAANVGVKICHVSMSGFDTHANQEADHSKQLASFDAGLKAFYADLKAHNLDQNVLIMSWSEFGRRVTANASDGTDHGAAAPLFFMGAPVKGGLYGQRPDLGNLENGNLRFAVDFRSVYATVLERWLGVPSKDLLGGQYEVLPLLG